MTTRKTGEQAGKQTEQAEQASEQPLTGVFEATEDLFVDGVRAFNAGDRVPAGHVDRFKWREQVRRVDESED